MNHILVHSQRVKKMKAVRYFHSTPKTEILPLVALVVAGTFARYSYRALKRMDDEWDEYQEALREYRIENGLDGDAGTDKKPNTVPFVQQFKEGTMGIDLGSVNIRISYLPPTIGKTPSQPTVIINREGSRFTPNKIYYDGDDSFLVGRLAHEKMYTASNEQLLNPAALLWSDFDGTRTNMAIRQVISSAVISAFETLPSDSTSSSNQQTIFSIDPLIQAGRAIRPVYTYPVTQPIISGSKSVKTYEARYQTAASILSFPESIALFVPHPLAVVTAAEHYFLSGFNGEGPVMIIDVGGLETTISLMGYEKKKWKVDHAFRIENFGGETVIEALMNHVSKDFYGKQVSDVQDGMGLQRLYAASYSAVLELSSNRAPSARAQINIPFLSIDDQFQPRHLDMGISKQVLEAEFATVVAQRVIVDAKKHQILSPSLSDPKDLSSLMASVILRLLEVTRQNPFALRCIILVGGGARSPIIQSAIKGGLAQLAGEQYIADKLLVPKDEQIEELAVLGAALLGRL